MFLGDGDESYRWLVLFKGTAQDFERGQSRLPAFEQKQDGSSAAEAVWDAGVLIKKAGVALDGRALSGEPPGLFADFAFEAAAADGAGALAAAGEQHARAGLAIGRTLDADHGHQADLFAPRLRKAGEIENLAQLRHSPSRDRLWRAAGLRCGWAGGGRGCRWRDRRPW